MSKRRYARFAAGSLHTPNTAKKIPGIGRAGSGRIRSGRAGRGLRGAPPDAKTTCDANHWGRDDGSSFVANASERPTVHRLTLLPPPPAPLNFTHSCPRWLAACNPVDSREATRRLQDGTIGTVGGQAETVWLGEQEVRALAAPLCEEDLTLRGDEIVLGERRWP